MNDAPKLQVKVTRRLKKFNPGTDVEGKPDSVVEDSFVLKGNEAIKMTEELKKGGLHGIN